MKLLQAIMALILSAIFLGIVTGVASANVPGVAINAPPPPPAPNVATAGSDAAIKVVATHRDTGSPALHYVDRVMLYDGDKLLKEWRYDQNSYKKDEVWMESLTVPAKSDMHLRAVAHCTVHGYDLAGMRVRVLPAGTTPSQMMQTDAGYMGMQAFGYSRPDKAADFISAADTKLLQNNIKAQSGELKSFQAKMSDWMKSTEGKQFVAKFETKAAPQAAGEMGRQAPMATKAAKPTVKRMVTSGDLSDKSSNIPRATYSPTPFISVKPSLKARALPATKYLAAKVSPTVRPTMRPTIKYLAVKASASAMPTKKPGVKYLAAPGKMTPAESYGIYGLGGPVPSPPSSTATVRAVPSGSPTPVPGSYTPRYPGEAGAGKNVTIPPSPTPVATVKPMVSKPGMGAPGTAGSTAGPCGCVGLDSDLRYSGRGPGIVGNTVVQPPAAAPGPYTAPTATRIVRK